MIIGYNIFLSARIKARAASGAELESAEVAAEAAANGAPIGL